MLIAGFATGQVSSFLLHDRNLSPISEVYLGSPVRCLVVDDDCVIAGCADGGLRVIPLEKRAFFDSKPKWCKSVNEKSATGVSSLSVSSFYNSSGEKRRFCATGADDGTVVLYEMSLSL